MPLFIYKIKPLRVGFINNPTEQEVKTVGLHFQYLKGLEEKGSLMMAGRTEDAEFGIAIFKAESYEIAQQITAKDPAIAAKIFEAELFPYNLAIFNKEFTYE